MVNALNSVLEVSSSGMEIRTRVNLGKKCNDGLSITVIS